jgi:hypothetical protein
MLLGWSDVMTVKNYMLDLWCQLAADQCNFGQFTVTTLELTRYVHMDAEAIRALIVLPPPKSGTANHHQSLLEQVDCWRTSQGYRYRKRRITGNAVPWLGHWPIVPMRRLLGLAHNCFLLNPHIITICESHFRIMFCKFE